MTFRGILIPALAGLLLSACGPSDPLTEAQDAAADLGLATGMQAPEFRLADADGEMRSLAQIAGENGAVIYFNRSLDWCPYCQAQVIELDGDAGEFSRRGYGLAVVTYDPVGTLSEFSLDRGIDLTLLSDPDSAMVDAFGVRDPMYADPEHFAWGVPYPVTFVLGPDGVILAKFWHEPGLGQEGGYRSRIDTNDVLTVLDGL